MKMREYLADPVALQVAQLDQLNKGFLSMAEARRWYEAQVPDGDLVRLYKRTLE